MLRPAVTLLLSFTLLTGVIYPLAVTGVGTLLFPERAEGSLIVVAGEVRGSSLIGQPFSDPRYFWGRPSATSAHPYDASASSGSNLGPTNPALRDAVRARVATATTAASTAGEGAESSGANAKVPVDLVTSSASGLDPHISPAAARYQAPRVAKMRGLALERVRVSIEEHTEQRTFGVLGEPRVNVLELNLALDREAPSAP